MKCFLATLFCLFFFVNSNAQSAPLIDAAFATNDSTLFFFRGDKVVKYNKIRSKILSVNRICEAFPGVTFSRVEAALASGTDSVFFFNDNTFFCFNLKKNRTENLKPVKVNELSWPGVAPFSVTAALNWPAKKCFFFHKDQYLRFNKSLNKVDKDYPKFFNHSTWPDVTFKSVDAAFLLSDKKAYLFSGEKFLRFDIKEDKMEPGFPKDIRFLPGLKNALLNAGDHPDKFNYDQFVSLDIESLLYEVKEEGIDMLFAEESDTLSYTAFNDKQLKLYPWYGKNIVFLTEKKNQNKKAMYLMINFMDKYVEELLMASGENRPAVAPDNYINGRFTFAVVKKFECKSICSSPLRAAIEINAADFELKSMANNLKSENPFVLKQTIFKETCRNFVLAFNDLRVDDVKLKGSSSDLLSKVFTNLFTSFVLPSLAVPVASDSASYLQQKALVYLQKFITDKNASFQQGFDVNANQMNAESVPLMNAMLFFVAKNYGGADAVKRMWKATELLEKPATVQDLLDNYFLLACFAAQTDMSNLFEHNFKYPLSDKLKQLLRVYKDSDFRQ